MSIPQAKLDNVVLFNDVHRWLARQAEDIEHLRCRHHRLTDRRKDAVASLAQQLQKDVNERKKQVNEFSLELEQYTLRKFDLVKDDLVAAHLAQKHEVAAGGLQADRKSQQIHLVCKDLDDMHDALCGISDRMVHLVDTCCSMTEMEEQGLNPPPVAVAAPLGNPALAGQR